MVISTSVSDPTDQPGATDRSGEDERPSGAGRHAGRPRRRGFSSRRMWTALAVLVVILVPVRLWVAEPLHIVTGSMTPTLVPGEHVLAWKLGAPWHTWSRGEVVAFDHDGQLLVKRVVAVGGDRVGISDGRLVVNGHRVDEPYADPQRIDSVYFGPVTVPAGSVFVLGDNRRNSRDSRAFGPVRTADVRGRVLAVLWPLSSFDPGGPR